MAKRTTSAGRPGEDAIQGPEATSIIPIEHVQSKILLIRGQKVIQDADLATLYGVETRILVQAVKRNIERFPPDFMFQLDREEVDLLRSQTVISNKSVGRGGRRYLPYAFTEHGAIMAASVLNSERAVQASVFVVRAFVRLKRIRTPSAPNNQSSIIHNQSPRALRLPPSQKELNCLQSCLIAYVGSGTDLCHAERARLMPMGSGREAGRAEMSVLACDSEVWQLNFILDSVEYRENYLA